MAVRAFDITDVTSASVLVFERPRTRRDARRIRQRHALVGVLFLTVPFVVALLVLGVGS